MSIDKNTAMQHLNEVIGLFDSIESQIIRAGGVDQLQDFQITPILTCISRLRAVLVRLAPPGSVYLEWIKSRTDSRTDKWSFCQSLASSAKALCADYQGDYLQNFRELFNADLFSDFLGMAEYLLQEDKLMHPAAVIAGGVLEEHIRKLCDKNGVDTTFKDNKGKDRPKKVDTMNADLRKAGVYGSNEQKQVTAWYGIRTSAAHAKYKEFTEDQVRLMVDGLRTFISAYSA